MEVLGPIEAPAVWPLDHVPRGVMESFAKIILGWDALEARPRNNANRARASMFDDEPAFHHFGKHSMVLSLVSEDFREVTIRDGIFNHVVLHNPEHVRRTNKLLGPGARRHVTWVSWLLYHNKSLAR